MGEATEEQLVGVGHAADVEEAAKPRVRVDDAKLAHRQIRPAADVQSSRLLGTNSHPVPESGHIGAHVRESVPARGYEDAALKPALSGIRARDRLWPSRFTRERSQVRNPPRPS